MLSTFLASASLEDVPGRVVERALDVVLDGLGCALVGAHLPWSEVAASAVLDTEGAGSATLVGWGSRVPPSSAALLNGTFIQGFELDDYHERGPLHSAAVVLPSALATAESLGGQVSGAELSMAILLGLEVGPRLGIAMDSYAMIRAGWHGGAVFGALAASVTAARLRCLDAEAFESALGTAATQASGLMAAQFGAMVKRMNHGFAARNGYVAAALASGGFTGIQDVLEQPYGGFLSTFCPDHETDADLVTRSLGTDWELTRILLKPYACGGSTHPAVDAVLELRNNLGVRACDVESMTIRVPEGPFKHNGWPIHVSQLTAAAAQLNLNYVAAVTLLDGQAFIRQFAPARIGAGDILEVLERIRTVHDPAMDEAARLSGTPRATRVDVRLKHGGEHTIEVLEARGTRSRALSSQDVRDKYRSLAATVMPEHRVRKSESVVRRLPELGSAHELTDLLRGDVAPPF